MKKTQRKDSVRNIRKRIVSYLSICLVIMLGLGGAFITRYMDAGIDARATDYYSEHNFKDYELVSSLGITDADLAQIKETEGIIDTEGEIRTTGSLIKGELNFNVDLITITEKISVPEVVGGRAPAAKDECMVAEDTAATRGIKVGDKVKISMSSVTSKLADAEEELAAGTGLSEEEGEAAENEVDEAASNALYAEEFTVTGLMKHPDYLRRKSVDTVVLPWEAVNKDVTRGYYTHALVRSEEPEGIDIFSNKYFEKTDDTKQRLEELAETLAVDSTARAKKDAYDYIDSEWADAEAKLEDAQNQIDSGEAQLDSELAKARNKLNAGQTTLNKKVAEANKKIKEGESELASNQALYDKAEANYPEIKKTVEDSIAYYKDEISNIRSELASIKEKLEELEKIAGVYGKDSPEYKEKLEQIASFITEHEDTIRSIFEFFHDDKVMELAEKIKEATGGEIDPTGFVDKMRKYDYEKLFELTSMIATGDYDECVKSLEEYEAYLEEQLSTYEQYEEYIRQYEAKRGDLKKQLAAARKKIADGKKQLAAEKKKYQAKINNGWSLYYSKKAQYEQKLEEAKALLEENRELAEQKLAEARAEVEKIECKWLVFDRRANAGYVDIKSNVAAVAKAGNLFGILFMLISSIVCFSTLTIIIDEQRKMVGTVKAFGFLKHEILGKYLIFGVSAAVAGCLGAILMALGFSDLALKKYQSSGMYQFGLAKSVVVPGTTILFCVLMIAVAALATVIACSEILRSPASVLMKGGKASKSKAQKEASSSKGGSLYSRLIVRNMRDDKARVAISMVIIAFSTLLVGMGISMKLGYEGMSKMQTSDVYQYDMRIDLGSSVTDEDRIKIQESLATDGADYMPASYETHIFHLDDRLDALYVLTGNPDKLGDYFAVKDPKTGETLEIPSDGVLAQKKIKESYDFGEGSTVTVLNSELDECSAEVKGIFQNYVGRVVITSPDGYRSIFGEDPVYNCYYVKAGTGSLDEIKADLLAINSDVSFEVSAEFAKKFESVSLLYNLIVLVTIGISVLMSAMILSNLANIFLNRKKTELTVMRINGFSLKQTRGYLTKETIVTTATGVLLGLLVGAAATPFVIRAMEQPDLQFIRSFHVAAWAAAVVLEVVFSLIINTLVFRKVKNLDFRDVA